MTNSPERIAQPPALGRYVLGQLGRFRRVFAIAMVWSVLFVVVPMQVPLLVGMLVNGLVGLPASFYGLLTLHTPGTIFRFAVIGLVLTAVGYGATAYLQASSSEELARVFVREQRKELAHTLHYSPLAFHQRHGSGELLSRVITDTGTTRVFVTQVFVSTVQSIVKVAYPMILLVLLDPWVALVALAILPVQWVVSSRLQRGLRAASRAARSTKGRLTHVVKETLDGIETIQGSRAEESAFGVVARETDRLAADQIRVRRYTGLLNGTTWALTSLAVALAWWIGGLQVLAGTLSIGALVAVTGYVVLLDRPIQQFTTAVNSYQQGMVAFERIREVLESKPEIRDDPSRPALVVPTGKIAFRNVTFRYDARELFRHLDLEILPRRLTALVGHNGSGKSSLLKLVARLYDPTEGQVTIDGQDLREVRLGSVRDAVASVPQTPVVFTGTIAENIRLGRPGATDADVEEAARLSGCSEFVARLPSGLATSVGAGAHRLSGGEAQRLAIARALLRRPKILLLDEPNAALDDESEDRLTNVLASLKGRITIVVVLHHLDRLVTVADEVVELDRGRVVDRTRTGVAPADYEPFAFPSVAGVAP